MTYIRTKPDPVSGQIWMTRPSRLRAARRKRLLRIVAVTEETIAYVTHEDERAGQPKVRRGNVVSRAPFIRYHTLYEDVS